MKVRFSLLSALEKVFADEAPIERPEEAPLTGMRNEVLSFQAAFSAEYPDAPARRDEVCVEVVTPLRHHVRRVCQVPVRLACFPDADANYLRRDPGMYPDLLREMNRAKLRLFHQQWDAVWIDILPDAETEPSVYPVEVRLLDTAGNLLATRTKTVEILAVALPPQRLIHTKWLHADCLAQAYHVPVFSEEHWTLLENYIRAATARGINMVLTPIHTPPLDTRVDTERPTVQLVDVRVEDGGYRFGFEKLRRWVAMCERCGVEYYEMAHLFTQWGAAAAPKIVAMVDGEEKRIFGWDTPAVGGAYGAFLAAYLPALAEELGRLGIAGRCYFHISDEPGAKHVDAYLAAKAQVTPHLSGFPIIDALSDFDLYTSGAVAKPIPANNHIESFLAAKVTGLWTYYCVSQYVDVSNMFIAMPSARNRILGVQLYKYDLEGFLHWGYNFYNAQYSDYPVNPYFTTDGDGFSPAGDGFQVYPGPDGLPEESIRMMVTAQAMYDLRALRLLETLTSREHVLALIDEGLETPVTFSVYPQSAAYVLRLRARVNREIAERA